MIGIRSQIETVIRFGAVGLLTAAIYAIALVAIVEGARQPPVLGAAGAYLLAVGVNYWAHHKWTYRTDRAHRSSGPRYILLVLLIFFVNLIATEFLPKLFGVSYLILQVMFAVLAAVVSFIAQGTWVFSRQ